MVKFCLNVMRKCLICKENTIIIKKNFKCTIPGSDKVYNSHLVICTKCNHVQKVINRQWLKFTSNLYEDKYFFLGKHINFKKNKVISRDAFIVNEVDKSLKLKKNGDFIDIGCGTGNFLEAFKEKKRFWNLDAQDLSKLHIKKLRKKLNLEKFYHCPIENIKKKYDLISINHVLEHIQKPLEFVNNIHYLLKDNSYLIIRVPNLAFVHSDLTMLDHCSHFTKNSIEQLIHISKFNCYRKLKGINENELFYVLKKDNSKNIKKIKKNLLFSTIRFVKKIIKRSKSFEERIIKDKKNLIGAFGIGTSSFFLNSLLKDKIKFFVDEDPSKINKYYLNKKIYSIKAYPENSNIYVWVQNKHISNLIKKRIKVQRKSSVGKVLSIS